ncbi:class I SAM-dependent methyltransferase [Pseudonocardia bannensis]|uniref:Class I SAM-dependent methyltransferase n=1 Tax=Pseudonocardia bannensis TaxID=630973 RepID=A0A848DHK8_9PSEU|nr:class I SAM-dependent methyltransferase [Pseudonocardia bannensis]NMH92160.1 class I SAM-dependent methyltransferase [Pseudonocardia bannensis]
MAGRQQRATSFGEVAEDYDRLRPAPPQDAVAWLLPEDCAVAVDVAAGTGLLTRALARHVPRVTAVEPDPRMRAVLSARSPDVRVVEGRGEALPLPDASADAVLIASAWHWMDPDRAVPEIARVLRDGGRFGVTWTSRDHQVEWVRDLDRFRPPATAGPVEGGAEDTSPRRRHRDVELPEDGLFEDIERTTFAFTRRMTIDDVVDMLATYSGFITADPQERAVGARRARAALEQRFPGADEIDLPMRSWCWRADRAARARPRA